MPAPLLTSGAHWLDGHWVNQDELASAHLIDTGLELERHEDGSFTIQTRNQIEGVPHSLNAHEAERLAKFLRGEY